VSQLSRCILEKLWDHYLSELPQLASLQTALSSTQLPLDHCAIIDLPGENTGIPILSQIMHLLDYQVAGAGYLPDKQNEFVWLASRDHTTQTAREALPQIVIADFRLTALPKAVQTIIKYYAAQSQLAPMARWQELIRQNNTAIFIDEVFSYLTRRDWSLPSLQDYKTVQACNELLAWVLVFGRTVNHFGLAIHLLDRFTDLAQFNHWIINTSQWRLNQKNGLIKGSEQLRIEQSSSVANEIVVHLADAAITIPNRFVEFVWRYPAMYSSAEPYYWSDYFTGFLANNADVVIESLYRLRV